MQPGAQGGGLAQPRRQSLRPVNIKHLARSRFGVGAIGKAGNNAGTLVDKPQRRLVVDPLEGGIGIAARLFFDGGQTLAPVFRFGLDDPHRLPVYKQNIVGRASISLVLAHGDAGASVEVNGFAALHYPARSHQLLVDAIAGFLLRVLVGHRLWAMGYSRW